MGTEKRPVRYKVLITDYVWPSIEAETQVLAEAGATWVVAPNGREETLAALARDADAILTCFAPVTGAVIRAASRCVVVGRYGVGVDNIAVDTATELGIVVTYVPDYCVEEVSDHTMGLILALNRRLLAFDRAVKQDGWGATSLDLPIFRLNGRTLGIVGLGRIGKAVCRKARAFGMHVIACDPYIDDEAFAAAGARPASLEDVLRESDFVTLHTPLAAETRALIGEPQLRLMKPTAFLINCARGGLIDEEALLRALREEWIAGTGLDVLQEAQPPRDHPLFKVDNVLITPHVAFFSQQSVHELEVRAAREVVRVLRGEMPENVVNPSVLSHSRAKLAAASQGF